MELELVGKMWGFEVFVVEVPPPFAMLPLNDGVLERLQYWGGRGHNLFEKVLHFYYYLCDEQMNAQ